MTAINLFVTGRENLLHVSAAVQINKGLGKYICYKLQMYLVEHVEHNRIKVALLSRSQWNMLGRLFCDTGFLMRAHSYPFSKNLAQCKGYMELYPHWEFFF